MFAFPRFSKAGIRLSEVVTSVLRDVVAACTGCNTPRVPAYAVIPVRAERRR